MKPLRILLVGSVVILLAQVAWGQNSEVMALSSTDPLKSARVYPNPAIDYVSLKFEQPLARVVSLELHSIIGNSLEVESEVIDDYEVRIRVKDLPTGYYVIDVKMQGSPRNAFKFVKR